MKRKPVGVEAGKGPMFSCAAPAERFLFMRRLSFMVHTCLAPSACSALIASALDDDVTVIDPCCAMCMPAIEAL